MEEKSTQKTDIVTELIFIRSFSLELLELLNTLMFRSCLVRGGSEKIVIVLFGAGELVSEFFGVWMLLGVWFEKCYVFSVFR